MLTVIPTSFLCRRLLGALLLTAASLTVGSAALAADVETTPAANAKVDAFAEGKQAIDAHNWKVAADKFKQVVAQDPRNADAFNYLGYSLRWLGQYDDAFSAYGKALALAPNHKGALNYSGIAYLKVGKPDMARAQLAKLQTSCAACEETTQLAKAIADYVPPAQ